MPFSINEIATFEYLQQLKGIKLPALEIDPGQPAYVPLIAHIKEIKDSNIEQANADCPRLYRKLHELAAAIPVTTPDKVPENLREFHKTFFKALYENKNIIPQRITENLIRPASDTVVVKHQKDVVKTHMKNQRIKAPGVFEFSHPENWANKLFSGVLGVQYNPLKKTNIPFVLSEHTDFKILRFGAQVQGMHDTQPAFQNYMAVKKAENPDLKYHHIYFNLQKRNDNNFEARQEHKRTKAIEKLNDNPSLGIAVITLPADNSLFFEGYDRETGQAKHDNLMKRDKLLTDLIDSINKNTNDFYIPDAVKKVLFGEDLENLNAKVREMFAQSCLSVLGVNNAVSFNAKQRQAIFFDFVKFQLTDYIVNTVKPKTINISCKDAIDRGMVHALWYEFNKRIEEGSPMNREEFEEFMDVSALLVKERPMNDHRNLVWNVLAEQYFASASKFVSNPALQWVPGWLQQNYPQDKKAKPETQSGRVQKFVEAVYATSPPPPLIPQYTGGQQKQPMELTVEPGGLDLDKFNGIQSTFVVSVNQLGAKVVSTMDEPTSFHRNYHITREDRQFDFQVSNQSGTLTMSFTKAPWGEPKGAAEAIQILAEQAKAYFEATGQQPMITAESNSDRDIGIALKLYGALVERGMQPKFNDNFPKEKLPTISEPSRRLSK
ncbi:MAG: hypothetical protein U1E78_09355 [Gammaproteobacteria bacterium]